MYVCAHDHVCLYMCLGSYHRISCTYCLPQRLALSAPPEMWDLVECYCHASFYIPVCLDSPILPAPGCYEQHETLKLLLSEFTPHGVGNWLLFLPMLESWTQSLKNATWKLCF